jgi:hypothetical protein
VSASAAERITLKVNVRARVPGLFPFYDRVIETMPELWSNFGDAA